MSPGILGKKIGMTQVFNAEGQAVPVTLVKAAPCVVTQRKTPATDGYDAVQLGFVEYAKKQNKPQAGHLKKSGADGVKFLREFHLGQGSGDLKQGDRVLAEEFKPRDVVDVIGTSKGRGFTGVMKRHNFAGLPASHGVKKHHRAPGSVGSHASNRGSGRPKRGKRMAGRYGAERVTIRNLRVVRIDAENNLVLVEGAVPGPNGGLISIRPTNKKKR
jgi:large subunit ribosomal protein L3